MTVLSQFGSHRGRARTAFFLALGLLFLCGLAAYRAITHLLASEKWVIHTYEVRAALGDVDAAVLRAGRAKSAYVLSGNVDLLPQFEGATQEVFDDLGNLRDLIQDNPEQQKLCARLEEITTHRIALFRDSIQLREQSPDDVQAQAELERQSLPLSAEITSVMQQMRNEEQRLLEVRQKKTHRLFVLTVATLSVAFILALVLLSVHYRFLFRELTAREQAERIARDSGDSIRRLTGRLLQVQDAERRKFSRELHDSLGQYLVGVKMNLEMFATQRKEALLTEAVQLLDQSIAETRTISHLLHPPLLDEAGLASATKWYLDGFEQRSGIAIRADLPHDMGRLPRAVELGLFRALQESLTNIHRHSESSRAEIVLEHSPEQVVLRVRDFGKGMLPEMLDGFRNRRINTGVGLAGLRERMRELGGQLNIQPSSPGTQIVVTIPLREAAQADFSAAG